LRVSRVERMEIKLYQIKKEGKTSFISENDYNNDKSVELIKECKCNFKDAIGPREADKIGLPMPLDENEDKDVYMPRFIKRYIRVMYIGGALSKEDLDKPMLGLLAFRDDRLQKLFNDYCGV
jgi:hypothetical protein